MTYVIRGASLLAVVLSVALNGCGGGGGGGGTPINSGPSDPPGTSGPASPDPAGPSSSFAQQCSPNNTLASASQRNASLDTEKKWLRAYVDEAYLGATRCRAWTRARRASAAATSTPPWTTTSRR